MSSQYKISISEPRAAALRAQAEELDITINTLISQIVEGETTPAPLTAPPSFDDAAEIFLQQLEPEHRKLIEDCAKETDRSPASYILSYIKLAHDQGNTAKALPEALDPVINKPLHNATPGTKRCEWCTTPLEDLHARFCPDPGDGTESCGRQASLATLRNSRRAKTTEEGVPHTRVVERHIKV